jgi:signal transduction histidine kinase
MNRVLRFALLGNPVSHSASPAMHRAAFRSMGLPHSYDPVACPDHASLANALKALRRGYLEGANVTVPWKRAALGLADEVDPSAERVGAANVLVRTPSGQVRALNTDVPALVDELRDLGAKTASAIIIGGGGAGAAAAAACKELGVRVVAMTTRSWVSSEVVYENPLAEAYRAQGVLTVPWPQFDPARSRSHLSGAFRMQWHDLAASADIVIQATSAGLGGGEGARSVAALVPWSDLPAHAVALDVMYGPRETVFMAMARRVGLNAADGVGMLARQGALSLTAWLGVDPPLALMRAAVLRYLQRGADVLPRPPRGALPPMRKPPAPDPAHDPARPRPPSLGRYQRIVILLVSLVVVPSVLLSSVGVLLLMLGEAKFNLLLGILVLCFTGAVVTGVVLVWVFVRRDARLSALQADFVSKVSHELRTPLTSIRMFTETLALRRGDEAVAERCIAALGRESVRLQELIDRLLDWGRMESGRRLYDRAEVDVPRLVESAIAAVEAALKRHEAKVEVSVEPNLPKVMGDAGALKDALINLISNAYKYGGEPPLVTVRARQSGADLCVEVSDNGAGIERREQKRIFEKFYRIDDRLSRQREGSGLGLTIVQHVMAAHAGRVEVDSAPGRGSTFTLVLPLP